jgi:hypothetical protein
MEPMFFISHLCMTDLSRFSSTCVRSCDFLLLLPNHFGLLISVMIIVDLLLVDLVGRICSKFASK